VIEAEVAEIVDEAMAGVVVMTDQMDRRIVDLHSRRMDKSNGTVVTANPLNNRFISNTPRKTHTLPVDNSNGLINSLNPPNSTHSINSRSLLISSIPRKTHTSLANSNNRIWVLHKEHSSIQHSLDRVSSSGHLPHRRTTVNKACNSTMHRRSVPRRRTRWTF